MEQLVGVRFHEAGKIYYFASAGYEQLEVGEYVVVETSRGQELARVVIAPGQVLNAELTEPLKPITRMAYDEDLEQAERLRKKAEAATEIARQKARRHGLPMKVVSGSYDLDGARLTLLFTSEGRIDFRDLVNEVSASIGSQVQLRQVGPRDQAKVVGGYGRCGRRLCCSSWLVAFPAISIKMAKEQDLPLNPSKISGQCGRLLCCLSYENDMYRKVRQALPRPGTYVSTPTGNARVLSVNVPRETVTLQMETMQIVDLPIEDMGLERGLIRVLDGPPPPVEPPPPPRPPSQQRAARPAPVPVAPRAPMGRRPAIAAGEAVDVRPAAAIRPPAPAPRSVAPESAGPVNPAQPLAPPRQGPAGHRRRRRRGGTGPRPQPPQ
jgi:cell fate regulator YaaT (PSP1 superfamily)